MTPSGNHLLEQVRNRNPEALAQYVELNRGPLLGFIERQLGTALRKKLIPKTFCKK